jgi:hypothetical protein
MGDIPQEVIDLLNKKDQGYIGIDKPLVSVTQDEGLTVPKWHKDAEDSDNEPGSREAAWA